MSATELLLSELLALRCCVAALGRELLLRHGSDAFIHAQAQADQFAKTAEHPGGNITQAVRDKAVRIVSDVFTMADGGT